MSGWVDIDEDEAEQRMRALTRRLSELDEALQTSQRMRALMPDSFSVQLSLQSLESIRSSLEAERIELVSHRKLERIKVALDGKPFGNHTANVGNLGFFLIRFQKLYTSIAQALTVGPKLRGPIAREITNLSTMRVADVFPSSFGMEIFIDQKFDIFGESTASSSLQTLFSILNSADRQLELTRLSGELGPRAVNHLRHVLEDLGRAEAGVSLYWTDVAGTEYKWVAESNSIERIRESFVRFKTIHVEEQRLHGALIGASLLKDRFEFLLSDRSVIEGKIARAAKSSVRDAFGKQCLVTLDTNDIVDTITGETRRYSTLTSIEPEVLN